MIKQQTITDIKIGENQKIEFSTLESGKILSISVKLGIGIDIKIITSLDEEVLSVGEDGIYYPRSNITSRKYTDNPLTGEVQEHDYFYFSEGLLIELNSEGEMDEEVALKELVILYDDMQGL